MSQDILGRSKLLCYFEIDEAIRVELPELIQPQTLPMTIFHFHYSTLYFPILFEHFKPYFPSKVTHNHLRLKHNGRELPLDLPIGLFVDANATISVTFAELPCPQGLKLMLISWKRGYTIVNKDGGCDHVYKKLNFQSKLELYNLHLQGLSHGLHSIPKYEGNGIAIRILIDGVVIERKEDKLAMTIREYLQQIFGAQLFQESKYEVKTHNICINLGVCLKELLEKWNYNDGYCYLKINSLD